MPMTRERYITLQRQNLRNQNTASGGFRLVLTPHFEKNFKMTEEELANVDRLNESVEFDMVDSHSVTASSTITTYPIVNGDTVADHMIRQPTTVTINGKFSLYGNKPTTYSGNDDRLTNIQTFFERIKDEGVMCNIVTMERSGSSTAKQRFKARSNMALTNIQWNQGQADITFNFTFTEALTVNLDDIEIDYTDENLPAITDAATLDFTDTLLDWKSIDKIVIQQLYDLGLIEDEFLDDVVYWVNTLGQATGDAIVGGLVGTTTAGVAAIATLTVIFGGLSAIPVAGWIATGVLATVGFIAGAIWAFVKSLQRANAEREYGIQVFKHYEEDRQAQQECVRFTNYFGSIHQQLEYLEDVMQVYGIGSNQEQECMLYIDNGYYIFSFKKNNTQTNNGKVIWTCNITDVNETINKDVNDVASAAFSSIDQCTSSNYLFRTQTSGGFWVYLINKALFNIENQSFDSDEARQQAIDECNSDLTSFCVFVSQTNMDDFNDKLGDIVINAMKM